MKAYLGLEETETLEHFWILHTGPYISQVIAYR